MRAVFLSFLNEVGNIFRLGVTNLSSNKELDIDVGSIGPDKIPKVSGDGNSVTFVDGAAARTAIGLGSMATQNANAVAITGGSGAFTGAISTTDTTQSTSTTTGSIRGAGAGFTGNLNVGGTINGLSTKLGTGNSFLIGLPGLGESYWGIDNFGIGTAPLHSLTSGNNNAAIGKLPLYSLQSGNNNLAIGRQPLTSLPGGSNNLAIGNLAGTALLAGNNTVMIGSLAGQTSTSLFESVLIGNSAGKNFNGSGVVFIGNRAGETATRSSTLYISNSQVETPLIYGEFDTNNLSLMGAPKSFGGGAGVLNLPVATTVPTSNPTSGFLVYQKPTGEVCVRDQSGEKAVTGANAGAFTGAISTTDTTQSTSTTTGSIRGAGAGFTGNLYVGGLTSIGGVTLEKINSLLYTPTQKRGIVTNSVSLLLGNIGASISHPSPESVVGRFDFFHTAGDQGILVEGGGNSRGWIFYVLQDELWWHAGEAGATGDAPGRFEGSTLIEPGLNTVEFYFSISQESRVFLNGRLVDQKQITMTSMIHLGSDNMYFWGSGAPLGTWPANYLPPELVVTYPVESKGLFAYAFNLPVNLLPATGTIIRFFDGSTLAPNANGDLVFTSKNNNSTTIALA